MLKYSWQIFKIDFLRNGASYENFSLYIFYVLFFRLQCNLYIRIQAYTANILNFTEEMSNLMKFEN